MNNVYTKGSPMLNGVDSYERKHIPAPEQEYNVADRLYSQRLHMPRQTFDKIFTAVAKDLAGNNLPVFKQLQQGNIPEKDFMDMIEKTIRKNFGTLFTHQSDFDAMLERVRVMAMKYYVLQPLIDDPAVDDITICGPRDIRVRVNGKYMQSNAYFIDDADVSRFINGLAIRNRKNFDDSLSVTFTDDHDTNYVFRFVVITQKTASVPHPYLNMRKQPKKKLYAEDLMAAGMFDERILNYCIDRLYESHGIVIAGPPGSGKSRFLNAVAIENIPPERGTAVFQENVELSTTRHGFLFHQLPQTKDGMADEDALARLVAMAVVEGVNEIVIGEAKGPETRKAASLANTGCHVVMTTHSNSAEEVHGRLADLVMQGSDSFSIKDAKAYVKNFDTVIYLEGYKVQQILEVTGYDRETDEFSYNYIYERSAEGG